MAKKKSKIGKPILSDKTLKINLTKKEQSVYLELISQLLLS